MSQGGEEKVKYVPKGGKHSEESSEKKTNLENKYTFWYSMKSTEKGMSKETYESAIKKIASFDNVRPLVTYF
jgi:hypothetical protein